MPNGSDCAIDPTFEVVMFDEALELLGTPLHHIPKSGSQTRRKAATSQG